MATPIDVDVLKCRKICPLFAWPKNNKISAASRTVATARIAPKIWLGQPPAFGSQYLRFHPNWFTFGGVIAERMKVVFAP